MILFCVGFVTVALSFFTIKLKSKREIVGFNLSRDHSCSYIYEISKDN